MVSPQRYTRLNHFDVSRIGQLTLEEIPKPRLLGHRLVLEDF
jgi:hypothetical protein